jgi:hypothetical protein
MKWLMIPGFLTVLLTACATSSAPLSTANSPVDLLPSSPTKGTLFTYYQPKSNSKWRNNWTSALDFTGVSWNDARAATLISPSYVVMAAHFTRDSHTPVMFHDRSGKPYERYIVAVRMLGAVGDISVGKLNLPLPGQIKTYRFATVADAAPGTPVITTDQTLTASIHEVAATGGGHVAFNFNSKIDPIYRRNLVVGDSGHPSFILKKGELLLLETHTTGGPGAGPFYGDPAVQAAIRGAMSEMGN